MKPTKLAYALLAALFIAALPATPALAVTVDTYISTAGNDGNSCIITAPCLTMAHTVAQTQPGGVLHCLDSNDYGSATITASITINCSNTTAGAGPFIVNGANVVVHIKGLTMWLLATAVDFQNGAALYIENCDLFLNTNSILFRPSGNAALYVIGGTFHENGDAATSGSGGIFIKPASGKQANVTINGAVVANNLFGIFVDGTAGGSVHGVISDSVVSGNAHNGITISTSGAASTLGIENTRIVSNNFGLASLGSGAAMLVSRSFITANGTGVDPNNGGQIFSYGDNKVNGNTADGSFTTVIGTK